MHAKIALIEDEPDIRRILRDFLEKNGCTVIEAPDGTAASKLLAAEQFDLILMDLMLPGISGEQLIAALRTHSDTPVIVISAKSMLETRLEVLRLGADDYILKPFDLNEVLVRMEVVLRRAGSPQLPEILRCGGLTMYPAENRVCWQNSPLSLTAKEFQLLLLFMEHPQKVYSKANLYESVWNAEYCYEDNTVSVHVSNLRAKLKKAAGCDLIETVWGIGYRMKGVT
ncbi:MAG: response regulator transcription factor [Oscillospiraceae bacterium]|nr:response regulator transcription factor [Oscillospiraceae bacterium]